MAKRGKRADSKDTRSQLREVCKWPGCDAPVWVFKGEKMAHCKPHQGENAAKEYDRRARLKADGKCRCGRPLFPEAETCFRCAFGVEQAEVEDWAGLLRVDLVKDGSRVKLKTNSRRFDKMLRVLGGGD